MCDSSLKYTWKFSRMVLLDLAAVGLYMRIHEIELAFISADCYTDKHLYCRPSTGHMIAREYRPWPLLLNDSVG